MTQRRIKLDFDVEDPRLKDFCAPLIRDGLLERGILEHNSCRPFSLKELRIMIPYGHEPEINIYGCQEKGPVYFLRFGETECPYDKPASAYGVWLLYLIDSGITTAAECNLRMMKAKSRNAPDDDFYYTEQIKLPSYNYQNLLKAIAIILAMTWMAVKLQELFNL
jgi:hypothetical protein